MESALFSRPLASFWEMPPSQRESLLLQAIAEAHAWHYTRNRAYRHTVAARGVGPTIEPSDLPLLLRPTAQTFKSYIEILGTPFPQEKPHAFLVWLAEQLSIELPQERFARFRARYGSLEALLQEIERVFSDLGFELLTSSGTSGRSTIMVPSGDGSDDRELLPVLPALHGHAGRAPYDFYHAPRYAHRHGAHGHL